ncbi:MAG: HDOD domain-containing protein [Desulfosarcinaceae bacterium]|nr:HDOD domain-containing protein [Desulfosarcinaceae bacterium]
MTTGTQPFGHKIHLHQLPSLPQVIIKLIEACNNEDCSLGELAEIIRQDPALSNQILKTVNSAFYGLAHKVGDIDQAAAVLGTETIKHIALCSSVQQIFRAQGKKGAFDHKAFWWHSLKSAIVARLLAERLSYPAPDEAFLSGLLHDIGKLVLWINYGEAYTDLIVTHMGQPGMLLEGEAELAAGHPEIGAWLINQWHLQSFMADAILYHHQPMDRIMTASRLVQIVYAANRMSQEAVEESKISRETCEVLFDFMPQQVETILDQAAESLEAVAANLGLAIAPPSLPDAAATAPDTATAAAAPPLSEISSTDPGADRLRDMVRQQALSLGLIQELLTASDRNAVATAVVKSIHLLLEVDQAFLFVTDPRHQMLRACPQSNSPRQAAVGELLISMQDDASVLVRALKEGRHQLTPQAAAVSNGSLVDQQLLRFMERPAILCIPLNVHGEAVGVLALGVTQEEQPAIDMQMEQLTLLTQLTATALSALRKQDEAKRQAQEERLRAATHLARRVVHEVRNPLTIMKNYLKVLDAQLAEHHLDRETVGILGEEIDRVTRLLKPMANLAEVRPTTLKSVAINPILEGFVRIMRDAMREGPKIEFKLDLDAELPPVRADKDGLKQIFINLLKNAMEALVDGGRIEIRTQKMSRASLELSETGPKRADRIRITIEDNGPGLPAEFLDKLYTPFVTDKEGHSGLGLSVVHKLVRAFNGSITCQSKPGHGAQFVIELPAG